MSWHEDEYAALDVPFRQRGARLDDHLAAWRELWRDSPASFTGRYYAFDGVYLEPKPFRPTGPQTWIGGIRPRFPDERSPADLEEALEQVPTQLARGFGTICAKPSPFIDDRDDLPGFCRDLVRRMADIAVS